ncbi:MAG: SCO family protein [bacterium]|nr:SCO family protein [bacterium]
MRLSTASGLLLFLLALPAWGEGGLVDPQAMPGPLKEVGFDQHLGETLPLDLRFVDERGREVTLGDYFGEKPVVLVFVYYDCPMLCPMVLNGVAKTLNVLQFRVGEEFDVVAVSIDPRETPEMALESKRATVKRYGREETAPGWHFLLGTEESVARLTKAAGFRFAYVPENDVTPEGGKGDVALEGRKGYQYAHASGMIVASPEGTLSQYFYGLDFAPKHVRLALVEASENRIGSVVDQILLYCFRYDPELGKYTAVITRILRLAGVVFLIALGIFFFVMWRRERLALHPSSTLGAASR